MQDHGDNLYRRSLYTFWRRSIPPPSMANFDASARENQWSGRGHEYAAAGARPDERRGYVEAARVFAQRVIKEGGKTPPERIAYAFRVATARRPSPRRPTILLNAFRQNEDRFTSTGAAVKYVSVGEYPRDNGVDVIELAAYTSVTSLILNLHETVMKE